MESYDCVFLTQENADTTLECENEPSPKVFQETKIYSCAEAVVRSTDEIPLLNWIPQFAVRFLNKMRIGRRGKKSVAQFGEEELISFVKRIIQGVFVRHDDRTRTIVECRAKAGQILSDVWESMCWEICLTTFCVR